MAIFLFLFFRGGRGHIENSFQCDWKSKGVGGGEEGGNQKSFHKNHHCFREFRLSFVRISMCHWGAEERGKGA